MAPDTQPQSPPALAPVARRSASGPGGIDLARTMWQLRGDALWTWVEMLERHGPIARTRIPGAEMFTVYRARHAEHVLITHQDNYLKGPQYDIFAAALGRGLLTSSGEDWRRQRRLIQPMFAKRHVESFSEHMTGAGDRLLDEWDARCNDGELLDVADAMMGLTLDVVGRALFGSDLTGDARATIDRVMRELLSELLAANLSPLTWMASALPGMTIERALQLRPRHQRRFRSRIDELDEIVAAMIAAHRSTPRTGETDLLALLLEARDEQTGAAMSDRQVRDEVVTFLLAGHETTANALTWMWRLLSLYPDVRDRLTAEVDEVLAGRRPTFADADRLPWTRAVVQETMRLYPPFWITARQAQREDVLDGVRIPAGSHVAVLIYMTHHDPEVWSNPEGFDPGRFLGSTATERPRCSYIPFAAGRRVCVGNTFALTEATLLAAMIAQRYVLDLDPTSRVEPEALLTLRPRGGLRMRMHRRGVPQLEAHPGVRPAAQRR